MLEHLLESAIPCLALAIDDTITVDPPAFAKLASSVLDAGGRVVIITARPEQSRSATRRELDDYGMRFNALHFLPSMDAGVKACPHTDLNWFDRYLWHKVKIAQQCRVTHFIDGDPRVIDLLKEFAPEIEAIPVR